MENEILVSVVCLTYNHEKYIEKAIKRMLNQETDFKYEIIVHDDCSQDATPEILKSYIAKYPDKIRIILQNENQHSKGTNILDDIVLPVARGKYIALCECDDYWVDDKKLQNQIGAFAKHPECWICAHQVKKINADDTKRIGQIAPSDKNVIFSTTEVIAGNGDFVGTNSLIINKKVFDINYKFWKKYRIDYFLQIMGSLKGGMIYLSDEMSAYRCCSDNSWTSRMLKNPQKHIEHFQKMIDTLEQLNVDTDGIYNDIINKKVIYQKFNILKIEKRYKDIFKKENYDILREISGREKIKLIIKICFPFVDKVMEWRKYAK